MKASLKQTKSIQPTAISLTDDVPGLGLTVEQVIATTVIACALSGLLSVFVVIYQNWGM